MGVGGSWALISSKLIVLLMHEILKNNFKLFFSLNSEKFQTTKTTWGRKVLFVSHSSREMIGREAMAAGAGSTHSRCNSTQEAE